ncbi:MAG: hypothetical protein R2838_21780 [Caldilineaceae bacterium]
MEYEDPVTPPDLCVDVSSGRTEQLTFSNPPALAVNALVTPEVVSYRAQDGLEIPAFLYRPAQPSGAAVMYPTVDPRPSMSSSGTFGQYLVAKGTRFWRPTTAAAPATAAPLPKPITSPGARATWRIAWMRRAFSTPRIGSTRRAGLRRRQLRRLLLTAACSAATPTISACGVAEYGDMELIASWAQCNRDLRLYVESFLGHPATQRDVYGDGSTIFQVEQVQKPVLILHGLLDRWSRRRRRNSGWRRCANMTRSSSTRPARANPRLSYAQDQAGRNAHRTFSGLVPVAAVMPTPREHAATDGHRWTLRETHEPIL